ncbi:MAG: L-histidine N(alpha)-methyltransferase [Burkholderiales bacterium]|nr:L-histidine N(alpha)-methyltransferase [Burkholderiales bacterium]
MVDRLGQKPQPDTAAEIAAGLLSEPASISPKYFYDALGCRLFQAICELPEYYVTRTEAAIFEAHRGEIARVAGTRRQLVDLGAGDCHKASCWFPALDPCRYVAVDVARGIVEAALAEFAAEMPGTEFIGVIDDFSRTLDLGGVLGPEATTFFYPGSSIGNFTPDEATHFLAQVRKHCDAPGSGLLIGVDLVKDLETLERAYDDATGVTAAFNKNVLNHVNRLAGTGFDPGMFGHVALFNTVDSRIEMHLEAAADCAVTVAGRSRRFARGERIHTENSYKYTPASFAALLKRAGFGTISRWTDARGWFGVFFGAP